MAEINIYDTANQLEREFRQLNAFKQLQAAFAAIRADEASAKLFEQFKQASQDYQMKQMSGQEISEEDLKALQDLSDQVRDNEAINQLMASEQQLSQIMADINQIITKPLQEIYQSEI
ncbi:YlbF family regulator [Vaginisenegalia massiliensis]|uniref:YlbF family regulator n=1 Tax=Vaginisenegalia massiliensis TaxID=2058294 RepID=UPI000F546B16|nr:YlbF family regulator [Vaginisenegalia massiliensis]